MEIEIEPVEKTERQVFTVSEITRHIRLSLETTFSSIWIEGEVSGFIHHSSGHMYFTLKDENSTLQCVMFKRDNSRLRFEVENGLQVTCHGRISVYAPRGQYQLTLNHMEPKGVGNLQLAFEQLKKKLFDEGLFDEKFKKPIPFFPKKIGIVTSKTGAVIHDIKRILDRRFPDSHLIIYPVQVQGEQSKHEIVQAIEDFNRYKDVDVLILARGGGSLEDLWSFNEEIVARSIFESEIPVISAVGHEVDYTISDFVSDLRAPTPSAAAELVLPQKEVLVSEVKDFKNRMKNALLQQIKSKKEILKQLQKSRILNNPNLLFDDRLQRLDDDKEMLNEAIARIIDTKKDQFINEIEKLNILSPLASLQRGYSIVFDEDKHTVIQSTQSLKPGQDVSIKMKDGDFEAEVKKVNRSEKRSLSNGESKRR